MSKIITLIRIRSSLNLRQPKTPLRPTSRHEPKIKKAKKLKFKPEIESDNREEIESNRGDVTTDNQELEPTDEVDYSTSGSELSE